MSDNLWGIVIGGVVAIVLGALQAITLVLIKDYHKEINSRMTELLTVNKAKSHAEGVLQGKAEGKSS